MRDSKEGQFVLAGRSISEAERIKYLLGLLSPAERELVESEYFEDEDAFQQMVTAEDDLIDAYARGDLTNEERQRFEQTFASHDRVSFARAFADAVVEPPKVDSMRAGTFPDLFKIFQGRDFLRTASSATVILLVGILAWQINDRWRTTNGIRQLSAGPAELSKPTETLERSADPEPPRAFEPPLPRAQLKSLPHRERKTSINVKAEPGVAVIQTQDASLGNNFETRKIIQLPLNARNVVGLLSLPPDSEHPLNTYCLTQNTSANDQITIDLPGSLSWIRFRVALAGVTIHENYRMTLKTKDGRPITSVDWTEPLTPNQTTIDTPVILTTALPSGDYVLVLMGKESDGSFIKTAEYVFTVIKPR